MKSFHIGEIVVYQKPKYSTHPGPRARDVHPSEHGDGYTYIVDKFWKVVGLTESSITLKTRQGKEHVIGIDDTLIRKLHWWEKFFFKSKTNF
jgi:hypothetical protein